MGRAALPAMSAAFRGEWESLFIKALLDAGYFLNRERQIQNVKNQCRAIIAGVFKFLKGIARERSQAGCLALERSRWDKQPQPKKPSGTEGDRAGYRLLKPKANVAARVPQVGGTGWGDFE